MLKPVTWEALAVQLADTVLDAVEAWLTPRKKNARRPARRVSEQAAKPPRFVHLNSDQLVTLWIFAPAIAVEFGYSFPRFQQAYQQGRLKIERKPAGGFVLHYDPTPLAPPPPPPPNPVVVAFSTLGLPADPAPAPAAIRARFHELSRIHHPDRNPAGAEAMKRVAAAYNTLKRASLV